MLYGTTAAAGQEEKRSLTKKEHCDANHDDDYKKVAKLQK